MELANKYVEYSACHPNRRINATKHVLADQDWDTIRRLSRRLLTSLLWN